MYDYQILGVLDYMSNTQLLNLSTVETISTEQFISSARCTSKEKGNSLQQCSAKIECSVQELLVLLQDNAVLPAPLPTDSTTVAQIKKGEIIIINMLIDYLIR